MVLIVVPMILTFERNRSHGGVVRVEVESPFRRGKALVEEADTCVGRDIIVKNTTEDVRDSN